ncbi:MAG TPA: YetF domain-containing protein [Pyrinomonadaceae bacterium]|jgi:uncharacterized membrane protein YcaP (DUF421 family)
MHFALVDTTTTTAEMFRLLPNAGDVRQMLGPGLSLAEKMLRPVVVYIFLVIVLRIFGKRELAQLNPFDLVVLLSLSNTVQNAIIGPDDSVTGGLIGAFTLLAVNYFVVRYFFKHRRLDQIFEGTPSVLIEDGQLCREALSKELLTESELLTVAHRQGFNTLTEIERCVLEPGGTFFLQGKTPGTSERQQTELLQRLDALSEQIKELQKGAMKG